jgi:PAS domain S-box-containing protein
VDTPSSAQQRQASAASPDLGRLRHGLQALAGLLRLPGALAEEPTALLDRVADSLLMLPGVDLAYVWWCRPGGPVHDAARTRHGARDPAGPARVQAAVAPWLAGGVERVEIPDPWGYGTLALIPVRAGAESALGVIAGSRRTDFPDDIERVLLQLAAAEAAAGLERWTVQAALAQERGAVERAARRLALQQEVSRVLADAASLASATPRLLRTVCENLDWNVAVLWRVDDATDRLRYVDLWHAPGLDLARFRSAASAAAPPAAALPRRVQVERRPIWLGDIMRDERYRRTLDCGRDGPCWAIGFPVRIGGRILGVVEALARDSREPEQDLLDALDTIGHQLGQFIERTRAEEAASRSKARKAALLESALDAVVLIDDAGKITDFNAAAEKTFGQARATAIGRDLAELIVHPSQRGSHGPELVRRLLGDDAVLVGQRLEIPAYRADGTEFPAELAITRLPADGPPMFAGFVRDISERKGLERVLEQRALELAEADRRKTEFLAMLAHELRNPLAPIRNGVDLLRRLGPAEPRLQQLQDMIDRQTAHLARLIDDLLDISRVSRGKILLRREHLDAVALVQQTVDDHRGAMEAKDLTVTVEVPPGPVWLVGDPTRLAQAIGNLLNNAVKFTPPGGRVAVRMAVEVDERLRLAIEDTGVGMEAAVLAQVFEAFNQVETSRDDSQGGLGLGLALVKGLIELHGGTVTASSAGPGTGSSFALRLPVAGPPDGPRGAPPEPRTAAGRGRRVLVIEDKPDAAESMRMLLEAFGHQVAVAHTGRAGLALAAEFQPEVVLCDIGLPKGMDGYAVARALREDSARAGTYLIALTGYGQEEDQRRSRDAGFDLHLTKPVDPRALERVLAAPFGPREGG